MAKAAKKLPQSKPSNNNNAINDAIDELHVAKHMFECAYLAVDGSGLDSGSVNAIHTVMLRAKRILLAGIEMIETEQKRKWEAQS